MLLCSMTEPGLTTFRDNYSLSSEVGISTNIANIG